MNKRAYAEGALTLHEREILREIAHDLAMDIHSVYNAAYTARNKLRVMPTEEAVRVARERGETQPQGCPQRLRAQPSRATPSAGPARVARRRGPLCHALEGYAQLQ